ncbi:cobyrinate a,c-diamide synthase [Bacteroides hominis]|uniref:cobyrinate a,c-diamide synthase n=1 Tax=Bacteroides hominis TaxID=2763023 RepID=UPI0022729F33|nr:cobyrinate a,c-diamide synthase [Bacteroides fragilis]MCY2672192.1 cobyrinate a,c-diamide synthase [Bacteroides fragilis]MDA1492301.1 cobyrinate a,c-diamide synthase [Bacteroides fragilis]
MECRMISQFLIAAPSSGSGKTTVSRGLMALLIKKGLKVQPFKCGPDYIDTKYHTAVCGRPSINLDTFMASAEHVGELYARYATGADACIVEGMMGMYDGYDRDRGSSAEIARLLNLPVVLVVDAKSAAYSMAPLLSGFLHFRPEIRIAGVIFNRVGSPRHYEMLQEVCSELGISCLGYLPKRENLVQESRYLGLDFSRSGGTDALEELTALMETHIDYTRLLEETMLPAPIPSTPDTFRQGDLKISVACSAESFSFIYQEHLDILRRLGTVTFFNPEHNRPLPKGTDLLYLPGGYPEKCHTRLSRAWRRMQSVRNYAEAGGRVLAECGGMIYLSKGILFDRPEHPGIATGPQTGVFPFYISSRKADRRLTLGYRSFDYNGQHLRGHEFHYTQFESKTEELPESVTQVYNAKGIPVGTPVFRYKNVIASYAHLYWGEIDLLKLFE